MMKLLSEQYIMDLIKQAQDAIRRDDKHMAACCLNIIKIRIARRANDTRVWRSRAIQEAQWRIRLAKEKNRLNALNKDLGKRANRNFNSWLKARQIIEELDIAIQRLPEPPSAFGDGPDERVGWILREHEAWKVAAERNSRFTQHVQAKLEETTKMGEELIDERDEIIGHLEADLAHHRDRKPSYGKVVQDLTILEMENEELKRGMERNLRAAQHAEAKLAALRERAERIRDGEHWDLVDFVLRKTLGVHEYHCWKNVSLRELGVGGDLASCTCGAEEEVKSLQDRIFAWGMETFGKGQRQEGVYAHLVREIKELGECLGTSGAAEELADCTILLFELAGFHSVDLITEVEGKFAVNKTRKWGSIEEDGSILHIKE